MKEPYKFLQQFNVRFLVVHTRSHRIPVQYPNVTVIGRSLIKHVQSTGCTTNLLGKKYYLNSCSLTCGVHLHCAACAACAAAAAEPHGFVALAATAV